MPALADSPSFLATYRKTFGLGLRDPHHPRPRCWMANNCISHFGACQIVFPISGILLRRGCRFLPLSAHGLFSHPQALVLMVLYD